MICDEGQQSKKACRHHTLFDGLGWREGDAKDHWDGPTEPVNVLCGGLETVKFVGLRARAGEADASGETSHHRA